MDENFETLNFNEDNTPIIDVKWLRFLFYIGIASIAYSVISTAFTLNWVWLSLALSIANLVCLFALGSVNSRYRTSAILSIVSCAAVLLVYISEWLSILSLAGAVCSLVATYQQYKAHAELTGCKDAVLARKWEKLFGWQLLAGVLVAFSSVVMVIVGALAGGDVASLTLLVTWIITILQIIVNSIYLLYLHRTIALFQE